MTPALPRVVVLDDYQQVARSSGPWERLAGRVDVTFSTEHLSDRESLTAALAGATVVLAMRERTAFPAELFPLLPDLRLLVTTGMANAVIDLPAAAAAGVTVCGTGGIAPATAELTWALILDVARRVTAEDAAVRQGRWQTTVGQDLAGRTLGILGLGRLGVRVARVANAFELDVIAWSQHLTEAAATAAGATLAPSLDALLAGCDILTVHTRLSDRTRGLIGTRELALMRPGALLVNTSRGPIVDTPALVAALESGHLAGAGLDVFDLEPLPPDSPLRRAPNLVVTPHLGYVTEATYQTFFTDAIDDIAAWLDGTPVRRLG